jgi:hypothetical protein
MLWKFGGVYTVDRLCADHAQPVRYELALPPPPAAAGARPSAAALYVHHPTAVAAGGA